MSTSVGVCSHLSASDGICRRLTYFFGVCGLVSASAYLSTFHRRVSTFPVTVGICWLMSTSFGVCQRLSVYLSASVSIRVPWCLSASVGALGLLSRQCAAALWVQCFRFDLLLPLLVVFFCFVVVFFLCICHLLKSFPTVRNFVLLCPAFFCFLSRSLDHAW